MSVRNLLFEDLEVTGNAIAKSKHDYKPVKPTRKTFRKEIAYSVPAKKHATTTTREERETDAEPFKELGHKSTMINLEKLTRQFRLTSTDSHVTGSFVIPIFSFPRKCLEFREKRVYYAAIGRNR